MAPVPDENREKPSKDTNDSGVDSLDVPDVVINAGSSESEDEEIGASYMGYEQLPQSFDQEETDEEDDDSDEGAGQETTPVSIAADDKAEADTPHFDAIVNEGIAHQLRQEDFPTGSNVPNYMKVPALPRLEKKELLWNQPHPSQASRMESGQAEKIRNAMSGFKLPTTNIPDWAKSLTDDQWKQDVVGKLINEFGSTPVSNTFCDKTVSEEQNCARTNDITSSKSNDSTDKRQNEQTELKSAADTGKGSSLQCESSVK